MTYGKGLSPVQHQAITNIKVKFSSMVLPANQKAYWKTTVYYRQVANIRHTKSKHLKDSLTVLRLSLPNPLKPDVKSRMKM